MPELNPFRAAQALFDDAASRMDLDREARDLLRWPVAEHRVVIPVVMDDGSRRFFRAHRILHNGGPGPALGGLRWHTDTAIDASRAAAAWTTWQSGVLNLPHGGAAGAVDCNPKELSTGEKERLARRFVWACAEVLGAGQDILLPDVYTSPQIMGWMTDAFAEIGKREVGTIAAGKPLALGGTLGQNDAIARGAAEVVREAACELGLDPTGLRYAIFGFGDDGQEAATRHRDTLGGGTLVAVCDAQDGIRSRNGIDPDEIIAHKLQSGRVTGFANGEAAAAGDVLAEEVDVLYVSEPPEMLISGAASRIRARVVCELAAGTLSAGACAALHAEERLVLPDLLAIGGRLAVAHFELVQNACNDRWPLDEVHRRLRATMSAAYREVRDMALSDRCDMRTAAWMVGIQRVAEACRARGWC